MREHSKITGSHLGRVALVYVRQSTLVQLRDHTESTARQYALVEDATRLGWPPARVEVIDADLVLVGPLGQVCADLVAAGAADQQVGDG